MLRINDVNADRGLAGLQHTCIKLQQDNKLRAIDLQLAQQLLSYQPDASDEVARLLYLSGVLVSVALAKGQVCLPLQQCPLAELATHWPKPQHLVAQLSECACVYVRHTPADEMQWCNQPLVLDLCQPQARLYLARYFFYERGVYQAIRGRLQAGRDLVSDAESEVLQQALTELFVPGDLIDWQKVAAATACLQGFAVITGGPGTGKTTTVTRLLSALLSMKPAMHIALAAPTGKAAARMTESIRNAKLAARDGRLLPHGEQIPDSSFTLHRLLGWSPRGFRYHAGHPLPYDCIVVDEASMIDLPMMYHLMQALSPQCRLILLGDRDQLASVEAGSVLADLCDAGHEHGPAPQFAARLQQVCGEDLSGFIEQRDQDCGIQNAIAQLRVSHRFDANSGIGQLAAAVNRGDYQQALDCFRRFDDIEVNWHDENSRLTANNEHWQLAVNQGYRDYCRAVQQGDSAEILERFNDFQVLCATRQGSFGVEEINRRIERLLRPQLDRQQQYDGVMYPGRAIMISRNDYDLGLFNGDIGVVVAVTEAGREPRLKVAFRSSDGELRLLLPSRLPDHETAFAMTVHKSQGSEFGSVFLMLPADWQSVITRELIYTAITRAKQRFRLLTSLRSWKTGVASRVVRASGLRDQLWLGE